MLTMKLNSHEQQVSEKSLIEFPCRFPIKVMAQKDERLLPRLFEIISFHDPLLLIEDFSYRESSSGNYLGVTVWVNALNKTQLDNIYLALTGEPMVKVVL
jgi:UPF0250 protein EIKCOROL_00021